MESDNLRMEKIPVSVLVVTKNEERGIARCLESTTDFAEVIVIDSQSTDRTTDIAKKHNARVVDFKWNGGYPKKRQWCIDILNIGYDWILWLDADEVLTTEFVREMRRLANSNHLYCGYFVSGSYIWEGRRLKYGLKNNKLAFYHKSMIVFPEVDDLGFDGMGEIEGHYQPIVSDGYKNMRIGQIDSQILHYAYEDKDAWLARHERYARWESQMILRGAYPKDPIFWREWLKRMTRKSSLRPYLVFLYSYVFNLGFLDGKAGFRFALSRKDYCDIVLKNLRTQNSIN